MLLASVRRYHQFFPANEKKFTENEQWKGRRVAYGLRLADVKPKTLFGSSRLMEVVYA
jgi:hypothetical protein